MKIREIKNEIEALGFSGLAELSDSLIPTLNRCLSVIECAHPQVASATLPFFPKRSILQMGRINTEGSIIECPKGSHLSFSIQGEGSYRVVFGASEQVYDFKTLCRQVSLHFPEGGRVIFEEGSFTVFDISFTEPFPAPLSEGVTPLGSGYKIDLAAVMNDLLYLTEIPTDGYGRPIKGLCKISPTEITLPKGFSGSIILTYRRRLTPLDALAGDDLEIPLREELLPLLSLLASYYLWLDESPELAEDYRKRYEELSASIKAAEARVGSEAYLDLSRWA